MDRRKLFHFIVMMIFGSYVLNLYRLNELQLFIHPRYITISFISAIVSILVALTGIFFILFRSTTNSHHQGEQNSIMKDFAFIPLGIIIAICLVTPSTSLSSVTASQRTIDTNSLSQIKTTTDTNTSTFQNFSVDTVTYSMADWVEISNTSNDLNFYKGKSAKISGFLFKPDTLPDNMAMVSRFIITCCAVDARPVGIVFIMDATATFKQDEWIEIEGKFDIQTINGKSMLILLPDAIKSINRPEYPYLY